MLSRMAWDLCTRAFEMSREGQRARSVRHSLQQFGIVWFWAALALDGRALEVWRDYRATPVGGRLRLASFARELPGEIPVLPAWSLPNNPRMRGLGLGRIWVVTCPFCRCYHQHAPEEGSRPAHCNDVTAAKAARYILRYDGELPRGLWDRFSLSVVDDTPKVLRPPYRNLRMQARAVA
jgi:hypothetical protein